MKTALYVLFILIALAAPLALLSGAVHGDASLAGQAGICFTLALVGMAVLEGPVPPPAG